MTKNKPQSCRYCGAPVDGKGERGYCANVRCLEQECVTKNAQLVDLSAQVEDLGIQMQALLSQIQTVRSEKTNVPSNAEKIQCPNCAEYVQADAILCRFCEAGLSEEHFRQCRLCSEMIRRNAVVCRYCSAPVAKSAWTIEQYSDKTAAAESESDDASLKATVNKSGFGSGVRDQVFEVIVRQAMSGAPWQLVCAGPMQVNNICEEEVEAEVRRRRL